MRSPPRQSTMISADSEAMPIVAGLAHHRDDLLPRSAGRRDRAAPCYGAGARRDSPAASPANAACRRHPELLKRSWEPSSQSHSGQSPLPYQCPQPANGIASGPHARFARAKRKCAARQPDDRGSSGAGAAGGSAQTPPFMGEQHAAALAAAHSRPAHQRPLDRLVVQRAACTPPAAHHNERPRAERRGMNSRPACTDADGVSDHGRRLPV